MFSTSLNHCCLFSQPLIVAVFAASLSCCCLIDQPKPLLSCWPALTIAVVLASLSHFFASFAAVLAVAPSLDGLVPALACPGTAREMRLPFAYSLNPCLAASCSSLRYILFTPVAAGGLPTSFCVLFAGFSSEMWNTGCILSLKGSSNCCYLCGQLQPLLSLRPAPTVAISSASDGRFCLCGQLKPLRFYVSSVAVLAVSQLLGGPVPVLACPGAACRT